MAVEAALPARLAGRAAGGAFSSAHPLDRVRLRVRGMREVGTARDEGMTFPREVRGCGRSISSRHVVGR